MLVNNINNMKFNSEKLIIDLGEDVDNIINRIKEEMEELERIEEEEEELESNCDSCGDCCNDNNKCFFCNKIECEECLSMGDYNGDKCCSGCEENKR